MRFTVIMEDADKAARASFEVAYPDLNMVMPMIRQAVVALVASTVDEGNKVDISGAESNAVR